MRNNKFGSIGALLLVAAAMFSLLLAACGDSTTATTTSTSPVATTSAVSATSGTTTSAATSPTTAATTSSTIVSGTATVSLTTVAGTATTASSGTTTVAGSPTTSSSSTTVAGSPTTSGSSTTVSGTTSSSTAATITGATQISATGTGVTDIVNQLKAAGITAADAKFYYSDNDTATLATAADSAYTAAGYTFAIPTFSKPLTLPGAGNTIALYTKSGSPDVLVLTAPIPTQASQVDSTFLIPGLSQATRDSIVTNLKGHKSAATVLSGNNLSASVLALIQRAAGSMSGGGSTTPVPSPTK